MKLAVFMFVSPFAFVFFPQSLGIGTFGEVTYFIISYILGIILFCEALEGYVLKSCNFFERAALFVGAVLLFKMGILTDAIGILIGLSIFIRQKLSLRKESILMTDAGR